MHWRPPLIFLSLFVVAIAFVSVLASRLHATRYFDNMAQAAPYPAETIPRTIHNRFFNSRQPWQFPKQTPEQKIIKELRAHLEGIALKDPSRMVLASVFLYTPLKMEAFEKIVRESGLQNGSSSEVRIVTRNPASLSGSALLSASSTVESFALWGTTQQALAAWQNYPDTIRGISILGDTGGLPSIFYPILPGARLIAD